MLQINLLPVRQLRKRAKALRALVMTGCFLLVFLIACAVVAYIISSIVSGLAVDQQRLEDEKKKYSATVTQIKKLKKQQEELLRKISVIETLKTDSSITVRVLDEVANLIDPHRMWLKSLEQQGNSLTLSGTALDNKTIADYMERLTESPFVSSVDLQNSLRRRVSGSDLKEFRLNCSVSYPAPSKEEEQKQQ